jgi:hypothetical protein
MLLCQTAHGQRRDTVEARAWPTGVLRAAIIPWKAWWRNNVCQGLWMWERYEVSA